MAMTTQRRHIWTPLPRRTLEITVKKTPVAAVTVAAVLVGGPALAVTYSPNESDDHIVMTSINFRESDFGAGEGRVVLKNNAKTQKTICNVILFKKDQPVTVIPIYVSSLGAKKSDSVAITEVRYRAWDNADIVNEGC
jgi:hypothetical protein